MQQIIGGSLGGRRLLPLPKNIQGVRPTSSRVRGAIFDRLQDEVSGQSVLDIFAGTGATSIEALSRGAAHATLIELMPAMHTFLQRQIEQLGLSAQTRVLRGDARKVIRRQNWGPASFNLVFCDPPYAKAELYAPVLCTLDELGLLADGAQVIVERSCKEVDQGGLPPHWELERQRRYGDTELLFWRCGPAQSERSGPDLAAN